MREVKSDEIIGRRFLHAALVAFPYSDSNGAPLRWVASPSDPTGPSSASAHACAQCGSNRLFRPNTDLPYSLKHVRQVAGVAPYLDSSGLRCVVLSPGRPRSSQHEEHLHRGPLRHYSPSRRRRAGLRGLSRGAPGCPRLLEFEKTKTTKKNSRLPFNTTQWGQT